eukprot:14363318-Alexandrium_andersonii.AAC.1
MGRLAWGLHLPTWRGRLRVEASGFIACGKSCSSACWRWAHPPAFAGRCRGIRRLGIRRRGRRAGRALLRRGPS